MPFFVEVCKEDGAPLPLGLLPNTELQMNADGAAENKLLGHRMESAFVTFFISQSYAINT